MTHHLLVIPAPACGFINANQRMHWAPRARMVRDWRAAAAWQARRQQLATFTQSVTVTATFHRDHNRGRWDPHNLAPTFKAATDGLVDAGCLSDDSSKHITAVTFLAGEPWADAALVLTFDEIGASA